MPYDQLHLISGKHDLTFSITLWRASGSRFHRLAASFPVPFTYNTGRDEPDQLQREMDLDESGEFELKIDPPDDEAEDKQLLDAVRMAMNRDVAFRNNLRQAVKAKERQWLWSLIQTVANQFLGPIAGWIVEKVMKYFCRD
jgi:hypothetical protein